MTNPNNECWVHSDGGHLIILPRMFLHEWSGVNPPADGRIISANSRWNRLENNPSATDYDRAGDVTDYLGVISVGSGYALVLGDEPLSTLVQCNKAADEVILIRVYSADSDESVQGCIYRIPETQWLKSSFTFMVVSSDLCLMDSAISGDNLSKFNECEDFIYFSLKEGRYSLETALYEPSETMSLLLHRLSWIQDDNN